MKIDKQFSDFEKLPFCSFSDFLNPGGKPDAQDVLLKIYGLFCWVSGFMIFENAWLKSESGSSFFRLGQLKMIHDTLDLSDRRPTAHRRPTTDRPPTDHQPTDRVGWRVLGWGGSGGVGWGGGGGGVGVPFWGPYN